MASIVVIEDENVLRDLMEKELLQQGFTVHTAPNGQVGWALIQDLHPDLILLDLLMPLKSGYDVLADLRNDAKTRDIPCIVISNSGQSDDLERAFRLGADDVLIKTNFNPDEVVAKIKSLLSKFRGPEPNFQ